MDACRFYNFLRSPLIIFAILILAVGCSQPKNSSTVFPEATQACKQSAHPERYIVKKESGEIEMHYEKSREDMMENYVKPNLSDIAFVEQDQRIEILKNIEAKSGASNIWGPQRMGAPLAWDQNIKGQGVLVAVVDSGVDISHEALRNNIFINTAEANGLPGVDDDGNGYIDDVSGWNFDLDSPNNVDEVEHGTHVAGIIAADSLSPMQGVAPLASILPIDFMNDKGGFTGNGILAIRYAVKMGAKIINASWGSSACSSLLEQEISALADSQVLFVAAAGNAGHNLSYYPEYPAVYRSTPQITVSALTERGFMAWFTNYGSLSHVMAPGESIFSSVPGNTYKYMNGTSMAAPMVSGLAALLVTTQKNITVQNLKKIILDSTVKGAFDVSTRGEVNVPAALTLQNLLRGQSE